MVEPMLKNILYIHQVFEIKISYNRAEYVMHMDLGNLIFQLEQNHFTVFSRDIPTKIIGLIKISLIETYSTIHIDKYLSNMFHVQNYLKHIDALTPLLGYTIRNGQINQKRLKLRRTLSFRFVLITFIGRDKTKIV